MNLLATYGSMLTGVASPTTVRIGGVTSELSATRRKNCSASHLRFAFHTACKSNQSCPSLKKGTPTLNNGVSDDQEFAFLPSVQDTNNLRENWLFHSQERQQGVLQVACEHILTPVPRWSNTAFPLLQLPERSWRSLFHTSTPPKAMIFFLMLCSS